MATMTGRGAMLLERRLAQLILTELEFTADDVTADGQVAIDAGHGANARQNGIGSLFRQAAARNLIEFTGRITRSTAPHRKGGANRVWIGTEAGRLWARSLLG